MAYLELYFSRPIRSIYGLADGKYPVSSTTAPLLTDFEASALRTKGRFADLRRWLPFDTHRGFAGSQAIRLPRDRVCANGLCGGGWN